MSGSNIEESPSVQQRRRLPSLVQCCVTGARHLREGKPCQDAVRGVRDGDVVVLAVADGHGTSTHGDEGAMLAVDVAIEQLLRFAAGLGSDRATDLEAVHAFALHPLRVHLARQWADLVRWPAGSADADLRPYGSTLLFALACPSYLLMGQIGDGDILLVDSDRSVTRPIASDPNNFAEETASLCQNEAWAAIRLLTTPAPPAEALLLLSTDGYSKSYTTDAVFELIGPDYFDMFREHGAVGVEPQLREILEQVTSGGSGDDIALGMLYWDTPAGSAVEDQQASPPRYSDRERHSMEDGGAAPGDGAIGGGEKGG